MLRGETPAADSPDTDAHEWVFQTLSSVFLGTFASPVNVGGCASWRRVLGTKTLLTAKILEDRKSEERTRLRRRWPLSRSSNVIRSSTTRYKPTTLENRENGKNNSKKTFRNINCLGL